MFFDVSLGFKEKVGGPPCSPGEPASLQDQCEDSCILRRQEGQSDPRPRLTAATPPQQPKYWLQIHTP